jgi:hypothetical protein
MRFLSPIFSLATMIECFFCAALILGQDRDERLLVPAAARRAAPPSAPGAGARPSGAATPVSQKVTHRDQRRRLGRLGLLYWSFFKPQTEIRRFSPKIQRRGYSFCIAVV